jgi:hypothetical protein
MQSGGCVVSPPTDSLCFSQQQQQRSQSKPCPHRRAPPLSRPHAIRGQSGTREQLVSGWRWDRSAGERSQQEVGRCEDETQLCRGPCHQWIRHHNQYGLEGRKILPSTIHPSVMSCIICICVRCRMQPSTQHNIRV